MPRIGEAQRDALFRLYRDEMEAAGAAGVADEVIRRAQGEVEAPVFEGMDVLGDRWIADHSPVNGEYHWLVHQIAPTLHTLSRVYGQGFLDEVIREGRNHIGRLHLDLLACVVTLRGRAGGLGSQVGIHQSAAVAALPAEREWSFGTPEEMVSRLPPQLARQLSTYHSCILRQASPTVTVFVEMFGMGFLDRLVEEAGPRLGKRHRAILDCLVRERAVPGQ